jgi:hypothetical protein
LEFFISFFAIQITKQKIIVSLQYRVSHSFQDCGTVMIYCGSCSSYDFGKVSGPVLAPGVPAPVPVPDPDSI